MKNKEIAALFGKAIKYEFILLILLGLCAIWLNDPVKDNYCLGLWSKLFISDLILLIASIIFFVTYDNNN